MRLYSLFVKYVLYPAWMIKDGNYGQLKYIKKYQNLNNLPSNKILQSQHNKLQEVLSHAYDNTGYYRKLFDQYNLNPSDNNFIESFKKLPFLTKKIVKESFDELVATNIPKADLLLASTGGSTGSPMKFYRDKECLYKRKGQELFYDRWYGYDLGKKAALFVAASHYDDVINKVKAYIRNETCERLLRFDPYNITDEFMEEFLKEFNRYAPEVIKSFPNSLYVFAEFIKRKGLHVNKVKSITCTGENLYESQKELFKEVFDADVYEKYGTKECGIIASECTAHDGMHIFSEGVYVEILNESGEDVSPGEMGHLVITDLMNKGMPLIRYKIGDMAIAAGDASCRCGVRLPKIKKILGRDRDIILDSNGNPKPGYLFVEAVNELELDAQFQIVQTSRDNLTVKVVSEDKDMDLSKLTQKYKKYLGEGVSIEYRFVDELSRDPSGKYRYVISELN